MRYKIEKIAKRNNLNYSVVNFGGGFKGYEFSANSYNEKAFLKSLFRAKDLYIRLFGSYINQFNYFIYRCFIQLYGCIYCTPSARPVNNRVNGFYKCPYIYIRLKRCNA